MNFREFVEDQAIAESDEIEIVNSYLYDRNNSLREISRKTGKSLPEIYRLIRRYGNEPNRMSTNHENVRIFSDSGFSNKQIAELTGYSTRNVRYILGKK